MADTTTPTIIIEGVPPTSTERLLVWWYGSIKKNPDSPSEPKVEVCFRQLQNRYTYGDFLYHDVGITHLGQVRLGTIWQGQKKVDQLPLADEIFQVDFSDGAWCFSGAWDKEDVNGKNRLIPPFSYKLDDMTRHPKTRLVQFHLTDNPHGLIIPSLEVFSRLYGRSQYVKRILLSNTYTQAKDELIVPDVEESLPNTWQVTVDKHCYDGDGVFLAHLKHDPVTERRVRSIWGKTEGAQNTSGNIPTYPDIGPWFAGPAQLEVRGMWLDKEKKRFLALKILGCSDPGGVEIYFDRENTNMVTGPLKKLKDRTSWPRIKREKPTGGKDIHITHLKEPGTEQEVLEIVDPDFKILGRPRKLIKAERSHKSDREKRYVEPGKPAEQYSSGEAHGKGAETAPVTIAAPQVLESEGNLRDVWNALVNLKALPKHKIKSVASVSNNCRVNDTGELIMLPFPDLSEDKGVKLITRNWIFYDPKLPPDERKSRCVLLVRVETELGTGYLMEIQRRMKISKEGTLEETEKYKGLAFRLKNESELATWLPSFLKTLASARGIFEKTNESWLKPKDATHTYKHVHDKQKSLKNAVLNALSKIQRISQDNSENDIDQNSGNNIAHAEFESDQ